MKKGASTAIVTILVMLITISLILITYQWLLKNAPETQQELENSLQQNEGCLKIESIDINNTEIVIRNCGGMSLSNFVVYLDSVPIAYYSGALGAGSIAQINYSNYSQVISLGNNHDIKVSSDYAESPSIIFYIPLPFIDTEPPKYFFNSTNSTTAGSAISHNLKWTDNISLSGYIFQFCNGTWNGVGCLGTNSSAWSSSLSGWQYRKQHNITNSTGAGLNYTINITVINATGTDSGSIVYINSTGNSKTRSDFGDIRFTDSTGNLLNYWIESVSNGANATFWVQIIGNLTSTNQTIYIYYGNSTATNISNGNNTFLFFDDFSGTSLDTNKWIGATSYASVSGGILTYQGNDNWEKMYSRTNFSSIIAMRAREEHQSQNSESGFEISPCCNGRSIIYNTGLNTQNDTGSSQSTTGKWNYNVWYTFDVVHNNNSWSALYANGVLQANHTTVGTSVQPVVVGSYSDTDTIWVDWVLVRKYVSLEPAHGAWGKEETASGWVNDTWNSANFNGLASAWSNVTKVVNSTVGANIAWCVYANDTTNNWNGTSCVNPFNYITISGDTTSPTYSLNSTNSTTAGSLIQFNIYWTDNMQVSKAITSLWNGSSWINASSWCSIGAASGWCNQTMVVNSTPQQLWWKVYANDTSNNWNTSQNFSLVTTSSSPPILWFKFNEANGTNVFDSSGFGNNGVFYGETFNDGIINNVATITTNGKYGNALQFNGINNYVSLPGMCSCSGAFTVGLWFRTNTSGVLISEQDNQTPNTTVNNYDPFLYVETNGTLHGGIYAGGIPPLQSSFVVNDNKWHYATLVVNKTGGNQSLYIDGNFISYFVGSPVEGPFPYLDVGTGYAEGYWPNTTNGWFFFNGTIDEVRIWNRTLSSAEIVAENQSSMPVSRTYSSYSFGTTDTSGYANDTHIWVSGESGSALSFDGSKDYVSFPAILPLNNVFTAGLWFKTSSYGTLISEQDSQYSNTPGAHDPFLYVETNGTLHGGIYAGGIPPLQSSSVLNDNKWHYATLVINSTAQTLYVDGNWNASYNNVPSEGPFAYLYIGTGYTSGWTNVGSGGWLFFNGTIDEVKIWNRTLSNAEILNCYRYGC